MWMSQKGHSGDRCALASTLCKHASRKGDLIGLCWAMVRRVMRGIIPSEMPICGGGVCSTFSLLLVGRCQETIYVCIMAHVCFYVCCSDCVGVCGNVCCVAAVVEKCFFLHWSVEVCCVFV